MSLSEAIRIAVETNPRIGQAAANKRATEFEVRQAQGGLLPQVRASSSAGWEQYRQYKLPNGSSSNNPLRGADASVSLRQTLYDGFATTNEVYRHMFRAEAAAWRTYERSELVALDTAQAYIDVVRVSMALEAAGRNLAAHRRIDSNVNARFGGGRSVIHPH